MFYLFQSSVATSVFILQVASVLFGCCICLHTYVASICSKYSICFRRICCKCCIWMLHILQWLYTYVANVCFNCFTLFQYVATGAAPHALWLPCKHALQQAHLHHQAWSSRWNMHRLNTLHLRYAPSLSLALGHTRCAFSLSSLALGHACCALSRIGVRALCSLSRM
jgi:hypothetical protein